MRGISGMFLGLIFGTLTSLVIIDKSDITGKLATIVSQPIYLFIIFITAVFGWIFAQMVTTKKPANTQPPDKIEVNPDMVVAVSSIFAGLVLALKSGNSWAVLIPGFFPVVWLAPRLIPVWLEYLEKKNKRISQEERQPETRETEKAEQSES